MKKIVVLTILVLLAAMPLLASDVTFGGDLTWGFSYDPDAEVYGDTTAATVDLKAAVDDFNAVQISVKHSDEDTVLEEAHITHNLGAAFGLDDMGIGASLKVGYFTPESQDFANVSAHELESLIVNGRGIAAVTDDTNLWGYSLTLTLMDAININVANGIDPDENGFLAGVYGTFAGLSVEVYYSLMGNAFADGNLLAAANYTLAPMEGATLELGAGLVYGLGAEALAYGLGVDFTYSMFNVSAGFLGDDNELTAEGLDLVAKVSPLDNLTVYAAAALDLGDAATETLNALDLGLNVKVGVANAYFGYVVSDLTSGIRKLNASVAQPGLYAKFDINY